MPNLYAIPPLCCNLVGTAGSRCIGKITWNALNVRDKRQVADVDEIFAECMEHQRQASVDGRWSQV